MLPQIAWDSEGRLSRQFPFPCLAVPVYLVPRGVGQLEVEVEHYCGRPQSGAAERLLRAAEPARWEPWQAS